MNLHSAPLESTQASERNGNRGDGFRNFRSKPLAALLMVLTSILGITPSTQAHNLGQTDTSIAFDKATLELTAVRAGLNQRLLQPGDSFRQILKSTPAPAWFTGVGGLVTIQLCNRDS